MADYPNIPPYPDKYLMPDGSIVTFAGAVVSGPDTDRALAYDTSVPQVAKWLQPDGSIVDALPMSGGGGGGGVSLGETSTTAYRGDRGKIAYDHSQTTGNPHGLTKADLGLVKADVGLGNVDNTSDATKPVSTPQATAIQTAVVQGQLPYSAQYLKEQLVSLGAGNIPALPYDKPQAIAIQGNYAYMLIAVNPGFMAVYDITDKRNPILKGNVQLYNGPTCIRVSGNYAYITAATNTLFVVDITNPDAPVTVGQVQPATTVYSKLYNLELFGGRYAGVAGQSNGLSIIDLNVPTAPVAIYNQGVNSMKTAGIAVKGNTLFITQYSTATPWTIRNLVAYDITVPSAPVQIGILQLTTKPISLYISGNYAYIGDTATNVLYIVDITNPAAMALVSTTALAYVPNVTGHCTVVNDRWLYVMGNAEIEIFDVSDKANPIKVHTLTGLGANISGGLVDSNYIYIAGYSTRQLNIYNNFIIDGKFGTIEASQVSVVKPVLMKGLTGATGTFTTADSKTVTVTGGVITSIV